MRTAVDLSLFSLEAVLRTCYRFTDSWFIQVEREPTDHERVTVAFFPRPGAADIAVPLGDFGNELIDQQLRVRLAVTAGPLRELIVAQAFAEGNLLEPDRDTADYEADPLGIARSHWEIGASRSLHLGLKR